jgi:hypothetical protein
MLQSKTLAKQRKKRKKPPELVAEEEEAVRAKQRAIDEDSSSTESGDDSEGDLITLLEATSPHTADSPSSTPSSAPSGNATQEFAEFDGDEELLQGMELAMATEAQCMTPQAGSICPHPCSTSLSLDLTPALSHSRFAMPHTRTITHPTRAQRHPTPAPQHSTLALSHPSSIPL